MTFNLANRTIEVRVPETSWSSTEDLYEIVSLSTWYDFEYSTCEFAGRAFSNTSQVAQVVKAVVTALNTYAVPVICVLGILGDITSFVIFVFTSFRYQPCSQYLAALTFADTLFLLSQLNSSLIMYFPVLALAPGHCSIIVYMSYICSFLSAWFVVLMMIERYIVVCYPFRASALCNKKKSIILVLALAALSLVLYSHSFFTTSNSPLGGPCVISGDYFNFLSIFTYIDAILVFVIPFLVIVCLNLRIILTVRQFRLQHNRLNQSIRRLQRYHKANKTLSLAQVRSTKMLIWVSSVFIVLHLPSYTARLYGLILEQVYGQEISESSRFRLFVAQQICQFLYHINFAIDFIVYVMTSNNFRRNVSRCVRKIHVCTFKCHKEHPY